MNQNMTQSFKLYFNNLIDNLKKNTDGVGFEPTVRFHVHMLSKHAHSAALTPIQKEAQNSNSLKGNSQSQSLIFRANMSVKIIFNTHFNY